MPERESGVVSFLIKLEQLRCQAYTLKELMINGSTPEMKFRLRFDIKMLAHEYRRLNEDSRHYRAIDRQELRYGIRESKRDICEYLKQARKAIRKHPDYTQSANSQTLKN